MNTKYKYISKLLSKKRMLTEKEIDEIVENRMRDMNQQLEKELQLFNIRYKEAIQEHNISTKAAIAEIALHKKEIENFRKANPTMFKKALKEYNLNIKKFMKKNRKK